MKIRERVYWLLVGKNAVEHTEDIINFVKEEKGDSFWCGITLGIVIAAILILIFGLMI